MQVPTGHGEDFIFPLSVMGALRVSSIGVGCDLAYVLM